MYLGFLKKNCIRYRAELYEDEVIKRAIEALVNKLEPVEAIRFINPPRRKRIDSVKRHRVWQKTLNLILDADYSTFTWKDYLAGGGIGKSIIV